MIAVSAAGDKVRQGGAGNGVVPLRAPHPRRGQERGIRLPHHRRLGGQHGRDGVVFILSVDIYQALVGSFLPVFFNLFFFSCTVGPYLAFFRCHQVCL